MIYKYIFITLTLVLFVDFFLLFLLLIQYLLPHTIPVIINIHTTIETTTIMAIVLGFDKPKADKELDELLFVVLESYIVSVIL